MGDPFFLFRHNRIETIEDYEKWLRVSYGDKTKHEHERLIITEEPLEK